MKGTSTTGLEAIWMGFYRWVKETVWRYLIDTG